MNRRALREEIGRTERHIKKSEHQLAHIREGGPLFIGSKGFPYSPDRVEMLKLSLADDKDHLADLNNQLHRGPPRSRNAHRRGLVSVAAFGENDSLVLEKKGRKK